MLLHILEALGQFSVVLFTICFLALKEDLLHLCRSFLCECPHGWNPAPAPSPPMDGQSHPLRHGAGSWPQAGAQLSPEHWAALPAHRAQT